MYWKLKKRLKNQQQLDFEVCINTSIHLYSIGTINAEALNILIHNSLLFLGLKKVCHAHTLNIFTACFFKELRNLQINGCIF